MIKKAVREASEMLNLKLSLAVGDYDQTRDLALQRVRPNGIDLTVLNTNVEEIFYRFYDRLEWDVSELSMGMYTSSISRRQSVHRHSSIPIARIPSLGNLYPHWRPD
jgi:hypothetical protein